MWGGRAGRAGRELEIVDKGALTGVLLKEAALKVVLLA